MDEVFSELLVLSLEIGFFFFFPVKSFGIRS